MEDQHLFVVGLLVRHASHDVLLALRSLSRSIRDNVDARLAEYLIITEQDNQPATIRAPEGRVPSLWSLEGMHLRLHGPPSPESLEDISRSLNSTRVLDFVGPITDKPAALIFALLEQRVTVRLRANPAGQRMLTPGQHLSADEALFAYFQVMRRTARHVMFTPLWDLLAPQRRYPDFGHPMLDKLILDKCVINITFDPNSLCGPPDIVDTEYPTGTQALVVIFRALPTPPRDTLNASLAMASGSSVMAPSPMSDESVVTLEDLRANIDAVLEGFGFYLDDIPHTLVNIGDLNPEWIGANPAAPQHTCEDVIRHKIRADVRARRPDLPLSELEALLDRNLRFRTLEEYEREIGTREFRIETVEHV
ncbi:hypothetical protein CcaverHIS002_0113250 [Cutaneotrichosporon cavernicola]|nr:hypothetical protein CcaverHIS002_0113250 [Cutaneotrichosporon cavernicola]